MSSLEDIFEASQDKNGERICGTCEESKPFDQFYKDGKDSHGNIKYRRDCKDCYKRTRMTETKGGKRK